MKPWSKEAVYDAEIEPLMTQIIAVCKREEIPICAIFQYADSGEAGPEFCTTFFTYPHGDPKILRVIDVAKPGRGGFAIAETHITNPDGTKTIKIGLVR
jgi:hypothetical protein